MGDDNQNEEGTESSEEIGERIFTREATAPPSEPIYISDELHLEELIDEYDVVFVEFYAEWSAPCRALESVVEELAAKTQATVTKVDIDAYQELATEYQIESVPTVYLFANSKQVEQLVGGIVFQGEETLAGLIEQYISDG